DAGLLARQAHAGRGSLFPQPWLQDGDGRRRLDSVAGNGWRLVLAPGVPAPAALPGLRIVPLGTAGWVEADGVAEGWLRRHEGVAAIVRPDNYVWGVVRRADDLEALVAEVGVALGIVTACTA
ncbi:hypothetical protein, partial [Klebsiella pneumoniae]|uniref:hypothetical protein n=1 Tax=Klebsiella pneumoniae TaxID=573 RepID=UPI00210D706C